MGYLKKIDWINGADNVGGVIEIKVARIADIISIPAPVNGAVIGNITFKPGTGFLEWKVTHGTSSIKSTSQVSREGTYKGNSLPFIIPRDDEEIRPMLDLAEDDEFIILFKYSYGKQKIFGSLESPVGFRYNHDSGAKIEDGNFYECEFYYTGPDNLYHYDGSISTAPPGPSPAVVIVNGTTIASLQPGETIIFDTDFDFNFTIVGT